MKKTLKVRNIGIDVVKNSLPYISIIIDMLIYGEDDKVLQTISNFDRIYKRADEFPDILVEDICKDSTIKWYELLAIVGMEANMIILKEYPDYEFINDQIVLK